MALTGWVGFLWTTENSLRNAADSADRRETLVLFAYHD